MRESSRSSARGSSSDAAAIRPGVPVARVHVDLERASLVVVSDGERTIVATTVPEPTAGLVAFDLRAALRRAGAGACVRLVVLLVVAAGAWLVLRRRERDERRVVVAWEDGSELEFSRGSAGTGVARRDCPRGGHVTVDALGLRLLDASLLEGDFTLRSGKRSRWYLDKYRFETDPVLLRELGERLAEATSDVEPDAVRLACPMLGAVVLAASTAMASERPFIIVRDEAKGYGTANRIEGPHERR